MPRLSASAALVALLVFLSATSAEAATALYPDLKTLPPRDLQLDRTDVNGSMHNVLRFTNTAWNAGQGPLDISGAVPSGTTSAPATQTVFNDDGTSQQLNVGSYTIHPTHQHYHFDDWGAYELWTKTAYDKWVSDGRLVSVGPDLVGSKTTSCVMDEEFIATTPATAYPDKYPGAGCDPTTTGKIASGLSVGWGDTYDNYRPEQWIDLDQQTLADGDYVLRSVADPLNKIYESPDKADASREGLASNEAIQQVRISGGKLVDLALPTGTVRINDIAKTTAYPNVTVKVLGRDDVSGVDMVRLSNDGVSFKQYTYGGSGSSAMSIAWDLTDPAYGGTTAGGTKTVYAQFHDRSGKWSASQLDTIDYGTGSGGGPTPSSTYANAVLDAGPVSYWRLGETSGPGAFDEKGANAGTYTGSPQLGATGLLSSDTDKAVRLTGTQAIRVPSSASLALTGAVSLEAWIKPEALPTAGNFASVLSRPDSYSLQFNGPRLEFTLVQTGGRKRLQAPAGAVAVGQRYHVVGTYDGAVQRLYVNGVEVSNQAVTGALTDGGRDLSIGAWDANEFFTGTIDEVAVYGRVLTGLQAKGHYDAGVATTVGIPTPTALTAAAASTTGINLAWNDNATNETGYVLQRSTSSSFAAPQDITLPAGSTTYADANLTAGTPYWYRVKAVTSNDTSAWSNTASATTQSAPTPLPAAPTALAATATSASTVDLRWADNAIDETAYVVERSADSGFTAPTAVTLAGGSTTFTDGGLAASTAYWYRVRAVNGSVSSSWSNTASATTQAAPAQQGYAQAVAADAPLSWWRLGETSGTTAADKAGTSPGLFRGGAVLGGAGLLAGDPDRSIGVDGVNDWVEVADKPALDITGNLTLEAWIRPDKLPAPGAWASVVSKAEAYALQFNGPQIEFTIIQNGTRRRLLAPNGAIVAGRTYHVVGTYDGATQRLYVNGTQVVSRAQTGAISTNQWPVGIGSWAGWGEYLSGRIDETAVYAKTLSAARVAAHYSAGGGTASASSATVRAVAATTYRAATRRSGRARSNRTFKLGPAQRHTFGRKGPGAKRTRKLPSV